MHRIIRLALLLGAVLLLAASHPSHALVCAADEQEFLGACIKRTAPSAADTDKQSDAWRHFLTTKRNQQGRYGTIIAPQIGEDYNFNAGTKGSLLPFDGPDLGGGGGGGGAANPGGTRIDARRLVPVRAYLRNADIPPAQIGAYGVVAFRARPTSATRNRLLMACTSFVTSIPKQSSIPSSVAVSDQMLTVWPLDDPDAPEAVKDDCNFVIDHYDLYGGDSAIADAQRQGAKFGDDGPFLIGWSPSTTRGVPDKLVLVVDMSAYNSQDSFDHAFLFWKQKIVEDPALWRNGFSLEALRLAVRDFADHYGDTILKAVSAWKK